MIPGFRSRQSAYAGLAVHHERLSLIRLKQIKKQIIIEGIATTSLPAGSLADGKVNHLTQLGEAIKKLVLANHAEHCLAALALPVSQVVNKRIRVAACLNNHERAAEIRSNLKYYLPGMDERLYFDFIPIGAYEEEVELQFIAARAEQVETYIQLAEVAGLKVNAVDVDVNAIARGVRWASGSCLNQTIVILDRDISSAQLILLKQGKVISTYPIVVDVEELLIQQIKTGIHILSATEPSGRIEKLLLTGHQPNSEAFMALLESELMVPVEKLDSFGQIAIHSNLNAAELKSGVSEMIVALGLALRGFGT